MRKTKREEIAMLALQALIAKSTFLLPGKDHSYMYDALASGAVKYADALMKQLKEPK